MADIDVRYGEGTVNETVTAVHVDVTELPYPEDTWRIHAREEDGLGDPLFSVDFQGESFTWDNVIFPQQGVWELHLYNVTQEAWYDDEEEGNLNPSPYGRAWPVVVQYVS